MPPVGQLGSAAPVWAAVLAALADVAARRQFCPASSRGAGPGQRGGRRAFGFGFGLAEGSFEPVGG
eukprot:337590-Lingulodinium_polyedra.AAC.1